MTEESSRRPSLVEGSVLAGVAGVVYLTDQLPRPWLWPTFRWIEDRCHRGLPPDMARAEPRRCLQPAPGTRGSLPGGERGRLATIATSSGRCTAGPLAVRDPGPGAGRHAWEPDRPRPTAIRHRLGLRGIGGRAGRPSTWPTRRSWSASTTIVRWRSSNEGTRSASGPARPGRRRALAAFRLRRGCCSGLMPDTDTLPARVVRPAPRPGGSTLTSPGCDQSRPRPAPDQRRTRPGRRDRRGAPPIAWRRREISVELSAPRDPSSCRVIQLRIAYEDASMLIVDKPAGMVVHPSAGTTAERWCTRSLDARELRASRSARSPASSGRGSCIGSTRTPRA